MAKTILTKENEVGGLTFLISTYYKAKVIMMV